MLLNLNVYYLTLPLIVLMNWNIKGAVSVINCTNELEY